MNSEQGIIEHYSRGGLMETIYQTLSRSGADMAALTPEDFSPVDELHLGGNATTRHLMTYLQFRPDQHILDIGSGLGGPARFVVTHAKAAVSGIDLTPEYCNVATAISNATGLGEYTAFQHGNALALPWPDRTFDGAYTIHTAMNIQDKATFYAQIYRVLCPGAFFGIYDVFAGPASGQPPYPLPWAPDAGSSFLVTLENAKSLLGVAGFQVVTEDNLHGFAMLALRKAIEAENDNTADLGPHIVMGENYRQKLSNLLDALKAKKCLPQILICRKPTDEEIT